MILHVVLDESDTKEFLSKKQKLEELAGVPLSISQAVRLMIAEAE